MKKEYHNNKLITLNRIFNSKILDFKNKWKIKYNKKNRKYRCIRKQHKKRVRLDEYVFYSILNTDIDMELGVTASMIARSVLALYIELAANETKNSYIKEWQNSGKNIIILQGYNHKHLKYLENEAKFAALGKHAMYRWYRNRTMLVLSVFGRKEEIEDIFDGLSYLR